MERLKLMNATRARKLRKEAAYVTQGTPSAFKGVYRRSKKLGSVAAVISERLALNARRDKKFIDKVRGR